MDRKPAGLSSPFRVYEDFQPSSSLLQEGNSDTLILNLPAGFKKEQIRVQIDGFGTLKINGERPLGDNKWSRFRKDYRTPSNCKTSEIRAKFENGALCIIMPKTITTTATQPAPKPATRPESLAPPPSQQPKTTTPTQQTTPSQTESSKITPPPVLAPPSQKPAATESSKVSTTTPVAALTSKKPTATEPMIPAPPRMQTQPNPESQISTPTPNTEATTPRTKPADQMMEPKTDKGRQDDHQLFVPSRMTDDPQEEKKKKKKLSFSSTHGFIDDDGKHAENVQTTNREYVNGGGHGKMNKNESAEKVSHSGGGGTGSNLASIMDTYKNKIEGFMMELKKKSYSAKTSSTSNNNRSELVLNMAVAGLVVVALGVYATWSFKYSWKR